MARKKDTAMLGEAMQGCLASMEAELPFQLVGVWRRWELLVGEELAELARPLGRHKRTLIIGAEDHAAQQELTYLAPDILEAVNEHLGEECFDKVQVDLLMGNTPLDEHVRQPGMPGGSAGLAEPFVRSPGELGSLLGTMREDSPVARCYKAYVERFGKTQVQSRNRESEE